MCAEVQHPDPPLVQEILARGHEFGFFQLVSILERLAGAKDEGGGWDREPIRFRPEASLAFPPSDVARVRRLPAAPGGSPRFEVTVRFLGLYGPAAPTPIYFSELVCQTDAEHDPLRDFLDLFNHRLIALFARSWRKYRPDRSPDPWDFARRAADLLGLPLDALARAGVARAEGLLGLVGLFSQQPRSAEALRRVVSSHFGGLPVAVEECIPDWVTIPPEDRNRLGRRGTRLGEDLSLGERVRDLSGKFRVRLGPLAFESFSAFLPGGEHHESLAALVRLFAPESLRFDCMAILRAEEVPALRLREEACRLGLDTWLLSGRAAREMRVRFDPASGAAHRRRPAG